MGQKHGGQTLLEDSVGQLRWLNRQACTLVQSDRSGVARATPAGLITPLRELRVGDAFKDRRQPGHQDAAASGLATGHLRRRDVYGRNGHLQQLIITFWGKFVFSM